MGPRSQGTGTYGSPGTNKGKFKRMSRWAILFSRGIAVSIAIAAASGQTATPATPVEQATLKRYCSGCHNSKVNTSGIALDTLDVQHVAKDPRLGREWSGSSERDRCLPPAFHGLDEQTYKAVLASLESSLDVASAAKPDPGSTHTFRRLNRTEYQNSIRDLLSVEVDVASMLPQ